MELTPVMDERSGTPLYEQIYGYIRGEIVSGRIAPDAKLPSIRRLSAYLGLSRTPVELAYQQLLAEGYLTSRPRSGLFAAPLAQPAWSPRPPQPETAAIGAAAGASPGATSRYAPPVRLDFGYGHTDLEHFPFAKWRRLMNESFLASNRRLFRYGDLQGEPELRAEIAVYLHQVRGVRCTPEQIVVGAGTYHSLDLLCQLLKPAVSRIASEAAVNDGVRAAFEQHRFALVPIPLAPDGIETARLADTDAQAVYVTPSHQFPYGMVLSIGKRYELLNWAARTGSFIIENDYDGEFRYYGKPVPSLQGLDPSGERVVYVGTFSKALTPSFRISYLVLPAPLLARFRDGRHSYDQLASPILQHTLHLFMRSGGFERHMRKMRTLYEKKHGLLLHAVKTHLGSRATVIGDGSGLHILLRISGPLSEGQLVERAAAIGIRVYPVSTYELEAEKAPSSTVMLGFGGVASEQIDSGMAELRRVWSGMAK
ncbi:MAG: PLP-dependent aminotransferase family protein [Paenibacillaceae bacterium]|nr:PLP-dependent aminotransferase family protein [Paenibacillaceae bacterium]